MDELKELKCGRLSYYREITDVVDFVGESIGDREEGEKGDSGL